MASVYQIKFTDGVQTITIQPGTLNGPGGVLSTTDLQLYGQGTLNWGAGVDQNQLRLTENFAVEQSAPGIPQNEGDIGVTGAGINNPIPGQQWFNLTDNSMYVWDGTLWTLVGGVFTDTVAPVSPAIGDLWYDTNAPAQLKVYNGASFVSVAERYLLLDGGSMTSGADITLSGGGEILGLPAAPSGSTAAASKQYVDDQIAILSGVATLDFVDVAGDTMTGNLDMDKSSPTLTLNALSNTDARFILQENGSNRGDFIWDDSTNSVSIRKLTGGTINNDIEIQNTFIQTHSTNGKIRTPQTLGGDNIATLTTKQYVDDEIAAATAGLGGTLAEIFEQTTDPGGSAKNGDIWLDTDDVPSVYIKMNGVMRKVFPAQYS
jgi:hypothetical protein